MNKSQKTKPNRAAARRSTAIVQSLNNLHIAYSFILLSFSKFTMLFKKAKGFELTGLGLTESARAGAAGADSTAGADR